MGNALPADERAREGGVTIGDILGDLHHSIVAGRDIVINVGLVEALRVLVSASREWVRRNWLELVALALVGGAIVGGYLFFRARYLIPAWQAALALLLLFLAVVFWGAGRRSRGLSSSALVVAILATGGLLAVLAAATLSILRPTQFGEEVFGVAVSHFGRGPESRPSRYGRQIAHGLVEELEAEIQRQPALVNVRVREVGIIETAGQAEQWGQRLGADLVVWGRLIVGQEGAAKVHFLVLETPASNLHPDYPRSLPIGYQYSAQAVGEPIGFEDANYFALEQAVAGQSKAITGLVLGLAFFLERDYQGAVPMLESAQEALQAEGSAVILGSSADPGLVHLYLGQSYQKLGRIGRSVRELERAAALNDRDPAVRLGLAYSYLSQERPEEAQATAREAVALCEEQLLVDPDNVEARYDLGIAYEMLEEHDKALDAYLWVTEVQPSFYIAYISAGRVHLRQDRPEEAIAVYLQALEVAEQTGVNQAWTFLDLGTAYWRAGDLASAREAYLTAVELAPEQDWMHHHLGRFYESQAETDVAWESYQRLLAVGANRAWTNAVMGDFLLRQELYDQAIVHYKAAIGYNPEEPLYPARLGEVYLERLWSEQAAEGDAENAERGFVDALAKLPEGFPARSYVLAQRGRLFFHLGRYDEAIVDFEGALVVDPDSRPIQFALARAYDAAQDAENACAAYKGMLDPELEIPEDWAAYARKRQQAVCAE